MLRIQRSLPERYRTATDAELADMISAAKAELGKRLLILGHHYQRDEVIKWADLRGDSFKLAQFARDNPEAEYIVFCGVHFMAEAADILTSADQKVVLPDLNAGCSMADMADIFEVEEAWAQLEKVVDIERLIPITYMNSAANLKAFVAERGGAVCTSTNARAIIEWALSGGAKGTNSSNDRNRDKEKDRGYKVFFFPDQHLGRNTARAMGYGEDSMPIWNPKQDLGGLIETECKEADFFLWRGHCSVHQRFKPEYIEKFRAENPNGLVVVHPECPAETVTLADAVGSTEQIVAFIEKAEAGAKIAVGTEVNLVKRLAAENPDKEIQTLDPLICPCSTMFRIDAPHLAWVLEGLLEGKVVNQITVDDNTATAAKVALDRMLAIC